MKTLKFIFILVITLLAGTTTFAQMKDCKMGTTKTETIKVSGKCDLCKARIEKAAKVDGVTKAEWNSKTKMLTLAYNPSKVSSEDVQKKIAAAGHDTEKVKADGKAYGSIPGCCKYR